MNYFIKKSRFHVLTNDCAYLTMSRIIIWVMTCSVLLTTSLATDGLGVNWGTQSAQVLDPDVIVQILKDNNIKKIKLFDSDIWTVKHFAGTGIEVMVGVPNNQLESFAKDYDSAKDYVKNNVSAHLKKGGVDIKYVAVGNEPFLAAYKGANLKTIFPALKNIQKALDAAGIGKQIKATIPQNADVYESGDDGPSKGDFRDDIRGLMKQIVQFLDQNDAPFVVNIYPYLSLYLSPDFPKEFAFFDKGAKPVVDKNITYYNMFDANLDTLVWSLKKAGTPNVKIIVGEIGWPTDADQNADTKTAQRFYNGFFKKMAGKKGTPLYPKEMDYYLFSLTDENNKSIAPGHFERHWGFLTYDGQPKFPMDFSGNGQAKMPVGGKNVTYMPQQWCSLKNDAKDEDKIQKAFEYACLQSDCTCLGLGGSCSNLDIRGNASYAFNMLFQMTHQDVESCNFEGMASIVKNNISIGGCLFPLGLAENGVTRHFVPFTISILLGILVFLDLF